MRILLFLVAFSAICVGLTGIADAANVTSATPQSMVSALQSGGYKAVLGKSDDGNPLVDTASGGNNIRIVMSDCENHDSCTTTEFMGIWDCEKSEVKCKNAADQMNKEESPAKLITFNGGKTYIAYMYLLYDKAGISEGLFIRNFELFSFYNQNFSNLASQK